MKRSVLAVLASSILLSGCWETGTGEKVGVVTKLAKTGLFCKTWEGEIIRGGLTDGSGAMGQSFQFTIEDESLVPIIQDAVKHGKEVRIQYRSEAITWCRSDSGDHFLTKVEVVKPGEMGNGPRVTPQASPTPSAAGTVTIRADQLDRILDQQQQIIDVLKKK